MTASYPASSYRTLASFSRIQLLYFLQQRGTMTVGDLAEATGLHHNTAREHLQRLIGDGFVTCRPESKDSKGRPRMLYSAAAGVDHRAGSPRVAKLDAALRRVELLRRMLAADVSEQAESEQAQADPSPLRRQLEVLDDHLDQSGFDSRVADGLHVRLHQCPYAALVKDHPEVCRVHFGLLRAVIDQAEGPLEARELHPLHSPDTCTLDLHIAAGEPPPEERLVGAIIIHGVSGL